MRRKLGELERDRDVLYDLLDTLTYGDNGQILYILGAIRAGASLEEVRACVESGKRLEPEEEVASNEVCRALERLNHSSEPTDSE